MARNALSYCHYISTLIQQEKLQTSKKLPRPQLASRIETSLYVTAVALDGRGKGRCRGREGGYERLLKWFRNFNTTDKLIAHVLLANEIDLSNIS